MWKNKVVQQGSMYKYRNLENPEGYKKYFDRYWRKYKKQFIAIRFISKNNLQLDGLVLAINKDCGYFIKGVLCH